MSRYLILSFAIVLFSSSTYFTGSYSITDDYAIKIATRGVEGTFADLQGTIVFAENELDNARFDVSVATASIATGNKTQDKHAKSDNWLNAEAHPRIRFVSSAFAKTSSGYDVKGSLTVNGETNEATIPFTFTDNLFEGTLAVPRADYNIEGPFLFGGLVGDEVEVSIRVRVE